MPSQDKRSRGSIFRPENDIETPFLDEDLFVREAEPELEARLVALEMESPFLQALEQGRASLIEPWELEGLGHAPEQETGEEEWKFEREDPPAPPQTNCGFHGLSGVVVAEANLRSEVVKVTLQERQKWWDSTSKTFQKEDNDKRFGDLVRYWLASLERKQIQQGKPETVQIHPGKLEAVQRAALDPSITYGNLSNATLNNARQKFGIAEKNVNDWIEKVYELSAGEDSAKAIQDSARAKLKSAEEAKKKAEEARKKAEEARKKAEEAVRRAEARVRAARGQSRSEAQAELDRKRTALSTKIQVFIAASQNRDAKLKNLDEVTRAHKTATEDLEKAKKKVTEAKKKVTEAKNARDPLEGPASDWKPADILKVRKALLAKAASTDPQNIDIIIDEALIKAHRSRADIEAWSAVFVVSCVRTAAISLGLETMDSRGKHVGKDGLLKASMKHKDYVIEARNRKNKGGTYHAFGPRDHAVQIGDIICMDRTNFILKPVSLKDLKKDIALHCDIVTLIHYDENRKPVFAETIGGNVKHTVRHRRYPLDSQGLLVVSKGHLFAQEEDDGTFLPFEILDPVPTMLATKSTGRIFALLSPVCKPASAPAGKGAPTGKREKFLRLTTGSLESPFFDEEILPTEQRDKFDSSVERLADESLFVGAFEERRSRFDEDQLEEEEVPDELEDWEELEAEEIWEELEEAQLTPQADQEKEESLDDEGAPLYEDEMELESSEDLDEIYSHVPEHELDLDKELAELEEIEDLESDEEEHFEYDIPALGSATNDHSLREIADGQRGQLPEDILKAIMTKGESDANDLTYRVFWQNHTDFSGKKLDPNDPKQQALRDEWGRILRRQVKPIIWLRQIIDQLDRHREDVPREFLLAWIAAESDGKVSTVSKLGERGYFQIMWKSGEAKEQLGLTWKEFLRLSTDREFSIEKGVQLAKKYRQHFLKKYPALPNDPDLILRLTKGRHAYPNDLDKTLDRLTKAGTTITWQAVSKSLPKKILTKLVSSVNLTLNYAAKLKKLSDLVPAPPATTPELYAESVIWIPASNYEVRVSEVAAEQATDEDLAEFDEEEMGGSDKLADDSDQEMLSKKIAESLPPRVLPSEIGQEPMAYETPQILKDVHAFEHLFQPMKRDAATSSWIPDGDQKKLEPIDPGFFDASGELKASSLNDSLKDLLTRNPEFSRYLSRDAIRDGRAKPGDRIRVALVDLTGSKLLDPEFAGWGSTAPVNGASCPKVAALYATFQLRNDLKYIAATKKITKTDELIRFMNERWKKEGVSDPPRLEQFLYLHTNPPALEFSASVDEAIDNIIDPEETNHAARVLIDAVGFPYIASLLWQSGLRHPTRGGLWLTSNYGGGKPWKRPSKLSPAPVYGHNATALSLATFYTLLAQDRLVRSGLPRTIKVALTQASWFGQALPSASVASKVGLLKKCLRYGPKLKDGRPVLDKDKKPVMECKESIATHIHEAGLVENGRFRYAVAVMTIGIPTGVSLLKRLIIELESLIRANNP